jgi:hypothetical protein
MSSHDQGRTPVPDRGRGARLCPLPRPDVWVRRSGRAWRGRRGCEHRGRRAASGRHSRRSGRQRSRDPRMDLSAALPGRLPDGSGCPTGCTPASTVTASSWRPWWTRSSGDPRGRRTALHPADSTRSHRWSYSRARSDLPPLAHGVGPP